MGLKIGIVGLPNVGKSTLFNALLRQRAAMAANYPFCTIEPNVGIIEVPDERLQKLAEMVNPEKVVPAVTEFVDIAGLVKGASTGEGLGNQFLAHIRECDAIAHLVRFFDDTNVIHVNGTKDPLFDREVIESELILADLQTLEKRIAKLASQAKSGDKKVIKELEITEAIKKYLSEGKLAINFIRDENSTAILKELHLITDKPILYVANIDEKELSSFSIENIKKALKLGADESLVAISAKVESDLIDFSKEDAKNYLKELGLKESGLNALIKEAYKKLGLITFYTAGPKEARAWTIKKGFLAPQAAGVIHSDFEKGFIKAEVVAYNDFVTAGGWLEAKERGLLCVEGKEYEFKDGDITIFRFS